MINKIILSNYKNNRMMVCGTSPAKIHKIKKLLDKIDVLSLNSKEFINLTNKKNIMNSVKFIRKKYRNLTIVITDGPNKIRCIYENKMYEAYCPKIVAKNENTAGDIFSSIFFGELSHHSTIDQSLKMAMSAGCLSVKGINMKNIKNYKKQLIQFSKKIKVIQKN